MNKHKRNAPSIHQGLILASNPVISFAHPGITAALQLDNSGPPQLDLTNVALDTSIMSFKGIKEIAEAVPTIGGSLKATCGVMVIVLETIKVMATIFRVLLSHFDTGM
jgi:hypothetical protein